MSSSSLESTYELGPKLPILETKLWVTYYGMRIPYHLPSYQSIISPKKSESRRRGLLWKSYSRIKVQFLRATHMLLVSSKHAQIAQSAPNTSWINGLRKEAMGIPFLGLVSRIRYFWTHFSKKKAGWASFPCFLHSFLGKAWKRPHFFFQKLSMKVLKNSTSYEAEHGKLTHS